LILISTQKDNITVNINQKGLELAKKASKFLKLKLEINRNRKRRQEVEGEVKIIGKVIGSYQKHSFGIERKEMLKSMETNNKI
jgi:hypothetical protein